MGTKGAIGAAVLGVVGASASCTLILGADKDYYEVGGNAAGGGGSAAGSGGATSASATGSGGATSATSASGTGGSCATGQTMCGGACVDTATDPANCGECGRDCQGTKCDAARCETVIIVPQQKSLWDIAVNTTNVFWSTDGSGAVVRADLKGGSILSLTTGQAVVRPIALDANSLYFANGGAQKKMPLGGGFTTKLAGVSNVVSLAISAGDLVFGTGDGLVGRVPTGGGNWTFIAFKDKTTTQVAADAKNTYWTSFTPVAPADGEVSQSLTAGGSITVLAMGQSAPGPVAVDAANVYWINGDGAVMKAPIGGGSASKLADAQSSATHDIAVDATSVYWTNSDTGEVAKAPIGGGAAMTLSTGQSQPWRIAVGETAVFWTNRGNGTIAKVAK